MDAKGKQKIVLLLSGIVNGILILGLGMLMGHSLQCLRRSSKVGSHFIARGSGYEFSEVEKEEWRALMCQCFENSGLNKSVEGKRLADTALNIYDTFFIRDSTGKLIGTASSKHVEKLSDGPQMFVLYNVCVEKGHRKQGVGRAMITDFEAALLKHYPAEAGGTSYFAVEVNPFSETASEAFAFYWSQGYQQHVGLCEGAGSEPPKDPSSGFDHTEILGTPQAYATKAVGKFKIDAQKQVPKMCMYKRADYKPGRFVEILQSKLNS